MKNKSESCIPVLKAISKEELEKEFNKVLLETLDEVLDMLGTSVKEALYFHLEKTFAIKKEIICENPDKLSDGLEGIFGQGAKVIEKNGLGICLHQNWVQAKCEMAKAFLCGEHTNIEKELFI